MKISTLLFPLLVATVATVRAEDFRWSWENGGGKTSTNRPAAAAAAAPKKDGFKWSWEGGGKSKQKADDDKLLSEAIKGTTSERAAGRDAAPAAAGGVDGAAYRALLDENLELRRKIAEAEKAGEATREENIRLTRAVRDLEKSIGESVAKIRDLKRERAASSGDLDNVVELERRLSDAEAEKTRLSSELTALQKRVAALKAQPPSVVAETEEVAAVVRQSSGPAPKEGSDLFRELERENALLKKKWVEVERERQEARERIEQMSEKIVEAEKKAARAAENEKRLKRELAKSGAGEMAGKQEVRALLKRIPALERELQEKRSEASEKESALVEKERKLKSLMVELERREDRLAKAERMQQILSQAREELRRVSDIEKRDMHYNMGAVYAKEGKFRLAEREYLRALQVDPNDAGVHYNLGILYDDELNDKRRAATHYRKYLKLNPHGSDVDEVKGWLMQVEMN